MNEGWIELVTCIVSIGAGILGFIFLQIPMNKLDWPIWGQGKRQRARVGGRVCVDCARVSVLLPCVLAVVELACLAGWIYLFIFAIQNNMACSRDGEALTDTSTRARD